MHWLCCPAGDFTPDEYETAYRRLTPSRKARLDRLKQEKDRLRSLAAELLLHRLLEQAYGITDAQVESAENGRPYLGNYPVFISLTHSGEWVACAASQAPIGIDMELCAPRDLALARRFFREEEVAYLLAGSSWKEIPTPCRDPALLERFYEIWTAKEAWFKLQGSGITELKQVNILTLPRRRFLRDGYCIQLVWQ